MKKNMVKALLIGATAMAMVLSGVGCTPKEEKVPVQSEAVKEDPNEAAVKELKKYIPKVDRLKVVQNAKNLDMTKAVSGLVDEKQKDKVESVKVDDSKLDETKPGTYEVTVTVTLKDTKSTPDSTKAPAKEDSGKEEDTSKDNTISGTVDVEIVDKDKADDLTRKGDVVITDDNEVAESDKQDGDKKENDKKDKKPDADKNEKPDKKSSNNNGNTSTTSPVNNNIGNNNSGGAVPPPPVENQQTTPPPTNENIGNGNSGGTVTPPPAEPEQPQHTHSWVPQYTIVYHEEVGHNEQVWVVDSLAWDEPIYEYRTLCNKCGADITGDPVVHSAECRSSYHTERVQVGTTHHEEVGHYETNWVVDSPAWIENVLNGQKCSGCGATR